MVETPTRTNDASMEMMAVRIMTQSLFLGFSRVCVAIVYVSSNYRDIVFLGNAPIPKYKAPWHRPLYYLAPDGNEGSQKSPPASAVRGRAVYPGIDMAAKPRPTLGTDEFRKG